MKKVIFTLVLVLTITIISGYGITEKNVPAEKKAISSTQATSGLNNKTVVGETKSDIESNKSNTVPESRPKILLMLKNETGQAKWSPCLWWNYQYANSDKQGC
jgi:hypothetical protein